MRPHIFTDEDLADGMDVVCVRKRGLFGKYTIGNVYYMVKDCDAEIWQYRITTDYLEQYEWWSLFELNMVDCDRLSFVQFYPLRLLNDKELFLFLMSGKLPNDVTCDD